MIAIKMKFWFLPIAALASYFCRAPLTWRSTLW